MGLPIDPALAWESLPALFRGLVTTAWLTALSLVFGLALAFPVCFARMSPNPVLAGLASAFVVFFRGAPVLILLYLIYNGFAQISAIRDGPLWFVFGSGFACAVIGLSLNHAGYMVEILRGGLLAVPRGVLEASAALGVSRRDAFLLVRLPLALRYGVKAYQNEVVSFIKGTAVVSVVTVSDLTAVASEIFDNTYDPFTPILTAAAFYWTLINLVRVGFAAWERRLDRYKAITDAVRGREAADAPPATSIGSALPLRKFAP